MRTYKTCWATYLLPNWCAWGKPVLLYRWRTLWGCTAGKRGKTSAIHSSGATGVQTLLACFLLSACLFCQVIQAGAAVQWTSSCRRTVAIGSHWTPHPAQNVLLQDELKGWNTWEQFFSPCICDEGGEMVLMLWVISSELWLVKGLNRAALRF